MTERSGNWRGTAISAMLPLTEMSVTGLLRSQRLAL